MATATKTPGEASGARIERVTLSDGSRAHNVVYVDPTTASKLTFDCVSADHARALKSALGDCSHIEVAAL